MILIIATALLVYSTVRFYRFSRLAHTTHTPEVEKARRHSQRALIVYVAFLLLSVYSRIRLSPESDAVAFAATFWVVGLVAACVFDVLAEKCKRRAAQDECKGVLVEKARVPRSYQVGYVNQNWAAADVEAGSPLEAANRYLEADTDKRWQDYNEIVVVSGLFGKGSQTFSIQSLLAVRDSRTRAGEIRA